MSGVAVPSPHRAYSDYQHVGTGGAGESWYIANQGTCTALTTATLAVNLLVAVPFVAPARGGVLDRIGWEITTLATAGNGRIGVYDTADSKVLRPGTLLVDSGDIALAAALQAATVSVPLSPGKLYWLAHVNNATPANTYRTLSVNGTRPTLGISGAGGVTTPRTEISVAHVYAALPATFTAGEAYVTAAPLALFMRFSA